MTRPKPVSKANKKIGYGKDRPANVRADRHGYDLSEHRVLRENNNTLANPDVICKNSIVELKHLSFSSTFSDAVRDLLDSPEAGYAQTEQAYLHPDLVSLLGLARVILKQPSHRSLSVQEFMAADEDVLQPSDLSYIFAAHGGAAFDDVKKMRLFSRKVNGVLKRHGRFLTTPQIDHFGRLAVAGVGESQVFRLDCGRLPDGRRRRCSLGSSVRILPHQLYLAMQ